MERKRELFDKLELNHKEVISHTPSNMFPQERDWTCAFACIRTILSNKQEVLLTEDELINEYKLQTGPYYSKDIKALEMLNYRDTIYGCDIEKKNFDQILDYLEQGYGVMLESLYNYAHWMVLMGYYPISKGELEKSKILVFDPYYNEVRLLNTEEFINMWLDADHLENGIVNDFIAIK